MPEQQSPPSRQARPAARHTQEPETQSMYPQQSGPPPGHASPASTQQRTGKLTPRRQLRSPQHSASLAQLPRAAEHAHELAPKSQSVQLPLVGPPAVPLEQVPVDSHQPQPLAALQVPQVVFALQGSAIGHELATHAHEPQLPVSGPLKEPSVQPVPGHQPQG